jgi:hypothetical protein
LEEHVWFRQEPVDEESHLVTQKYVLPLANPPDRNWREEHVATGTIRDETRTRLTPAVDPDRPSRRDRS